MTSDNNIDDPMIYFAFSRRLADGADMKMGNWNAEFVKKEAAVTKVKVESSPVSDMSAYYSDDNSDDDFKMPTKKRTKVFFFRQMCASCLFVFMTACIRHVKSDFEIAAREAVGCHSSGWIVGSNQNGRRQDGKSDDVQRWKRRVTCRTAVHSTEAKVQ